jgi:hypothetical protein
MRRSMTWSRTIALVTIHRASVAAAGLLAASCGARTSIDLAFEGGDGGDGGAGGAGSETVVAASTSGATGPGPGTSSASVSASASAVSVGSSSSSASVSVSASAVSVSVSVSASASTGASCAGDDECDDGVDCTSDTCELGACANVPVDAACDDGKGCTRDRCSVASGCSNEPSDDLCDDGIDCTLDSCDAGLGECEHAPCDGLCQDGSFCDGVERCDNLLGCIDGPPACQTGVACAISVCDEADETCAHQFPDGCAAPDVHLVVHDDAGIWEVAPYASPSQTLIAPSGGVTHLDIAILGDRWFAAGFAIRELAPFTNDVIRTLEFGGHNSLGAGPDGLLYTATIDVFRVDVDTSAFELLGQLPPGHFSSGDIAFVGERMFVSTESPCGGAIVEFDVASGTSQVLGGDGLGCVWGLANVDGTLYVANCDGKIGVFDPDSGEARVVATTSVRALGADALP